MTIFQTVGSKITIPSADEYVIVQVDETQSVPYNAVTYPASFTIDGETYENCIDSSTFTHASQTNVGDWAGHWLTEGIKPVYITNGVISGDVSDLRNMSNWDTTKDVFTQFPFRWLAIEKSGDIITMIFSNTDEQPSTSFHDYAFLSNSGTRNNAFHIGCSSASANGSALASRVGSTPLVNTSITDFITKASNTGTGYDIITYDQMTYLIALFIALFKTLDIQGTSNSAYGLGKGYTGGSSVQNNPTLTYNNDYGMYGDTSDATTPVSFFWLTNFFGNINQFIGGAHTDSSYNLQINRGQMSSVSTWNTNITTGISSNIGDYVTKTLGTYGGGFIPIAASGGSSSSFYSDSGFVFASYFPYWGGCYSDGDVAGVFFWYFYLSATNTGSRIGSRLSCKIGSE